MLILYDGYFTYDESCGFPAAGFGPVGRAAFVVNISFDADNSNVGVSMASERLACGAVEIAMRGVE